MAKYNNMNWTPVVVILVIVGVVVALFATGVLGSFGGTAAKDCSDSQTSLTFPVKNFYSKATSVTATPYARVDNSDITNLSTLSNFPVGAVITDLFYSASNYIDSESDGFTVTCGQSIAPTANLKATDNPDTFLIKDTSGTTLGDQSTADSAGANYSSTAGSLELELRIGATTDKTTGNLIVVVEFDNDTQAKDISISGATPLTSVPSVYSAEASNSLIKAFEIPEVEDGDTETFAVKVTPNSGETLGGGGTAIRFTRYSKQTFEDYDGALASGVVNSNDKSDTKYEDTGDYDVFGI